MPAGSRDGVVRGKVIHHYCSFYMTDHIFTPGWGEPSIVFLLIFYFLDTVGFNVYLANCNLHSFHSCVLLYPQNDAESILGLYCASSLISEIVQPLLCSEHRKQPLDELNSAGLMNYDYERFTFQHCEGFMRNTMRNV